MRRHLAKVDNDGDGVTGDNDNDDFDDATDFAVVTMALLPLVAMATLPSPMHRRLAVVDNDGNGATGDKVNDDGDGATTSTMMAKARRTTTLTTIARWRRCSHRCAGVLPLSEIMATAR